MTEPDRKFEEEIRRALCAASDLIVPAGDGLNLIRERAARRSPAVRWLLAYATYLPRQLVRAGTVAASEVAATAHGHSSLGLMLSAARRWPGKAHRGLRTPSLWLRPVLASATALLLVIAVTLSIPRLRQTVGAQLDSAFGSSSGQNPGGGPGGGGPGGAQSTNATPIGTGPAALVPGKPYLATMPPPGTQCRAHGTDVSAGAGTRYVPPSLGPGISQTTGARTSAGATTPATCNPSTAPAKVNRATSLPPPTTSAPVAPPVTTPVVITSPTTTPVTTTPSDTTSPTVTPTTPDTTSPTVTPTTPDTSTSSADGTESSGAPTEAPGPGN